MIKYKSGLAAAWQYEMHGIPLIYEVTVRDEIYYEYFTSTDDVLNNQGDIFVSDPDMHHYKPILGDLVMLSRGPVTVIDNIKLAHDDPHFVSLSYITATWDNDPENRIIMRDGKGFLWGDA